MSEIVNLEPRIVWEQFDAITQVPRPSKKEGKIIEFLVDFARKHNIEYKKDAIGNVVMRKPATPGFEDRPAVILQSHMDMVCEKNSDVEFDFDNDPIRTHIDGGWVRAEGTTLGADCGIGMAAALAVMIDPAVQHGPVEALFTVDEETGLTGAFELGEEMLTGKYLINLDSEDEGEIFIGCAGGIDTIATFRYAMEEAPKNYSFFRVDVSDLQGGHSGDDIDKGRVNSNKTVARLLWDGMQSFELKLSYFNGGNLRNAIPREAYAIFGVPTRFKSEFVKRYDLFAADLKAEFRFREPNFKITLNEMPEVDQVLDARTQFGLVYSLVGVPNGVIAMSFAMPGLVETSTNLASVKFEGDNRIVVTSSQRSSVESAKTYVMQMVESVFALAGADVAHSDGYPGWAPNPQSVLLEKTVGAYERLFGAEPKVRAIHAGLECGLFLEKYPELEMVSFGPTLRGVHSPDERLEIATVPKFWDLLLEVLKTVCPACERGKSRHGCTVPGCTVHDNGPAKTGPLPLRVVTRLFSRWPYHSRELDHGICQKFVRNLYMAFVRVLVQRYYYLPVLGIRRPGHSHAELYVSVLFPLFQRYFRRVVRYGQVAQRCFREEVGGETDNAPFAFHGNVVAGG